jgi:hypothetical protein
MPARMPRLPVMLVCLAALAAGAAACGEADVEQGVEEPAREGIAVPLDGVDYNVFITRQLNPQVQPDQAYYRGPDPGPDELLYGVFLQVCNNSDEPRETADTFVVKDNQGNEFEPEEVGDTENEFLYRPKQLDPEECIPQAGSVAQLGPTAGSMLLFRIPLTNAEYRPLELEIEGEGGKKLTFELDL